MKEGAQWIAGPLSKLFSLSLAQGKLPQHWTLANVTTILKKGNKHSILNYRPVSLTCITVKLLERIVFNHMTKFLTTNKKLSPFQHGFHSGHSCQTQLLERVHQWAETLDNYDSTHIIYLDFSKAFDTVPHQRLLLKLDHIGIRGELLEWIRGFLSNRKQRVLCDGVASDWEDVVFGMPQYWSDHILEASAKANRVSNLLRRIMYDTSKASKQQAYIALVRPHLEYCLPVWIPHQKKYINELEKLQKRAARWVGGVRWDSSINNWTEAYSTSCHKLGWLFLQNRRTYSDCCQTFKNLSNHPSEQTKWASG